MRRERWLGRLDMTQEELCCLLAAALYALNGPTAKDRRCDRMLTRACRKLARALGLDDSYLARVAAQCARGPSLSPSLEAFLARLEKGGVE